MTRIDFYQIDSDEQPLEFTCRLLEKIYRRGHEIFVYTADNEQARILDDLLWTFRPDRFIPHSLLDAGEAAPIQIAHQGEPAHKDVLVNLSNRVPEFFSRFDRVAEVVQLDENSRDAARQNYKYSKDRDYLLHYHQM
ncbi:MAG: DNA polymerase III subunit chi, partial [Pseudomonadales bacterium]|nr:DNA polymerase III subunit chi [Pseudomonadales bacterium]